jgi:anthranilate phosphoribosyltransferase
VLNSGAAIYVSGLVADYQAGINKAEEVIANGQAKTTWDNLVSTTQKFK